MAFTGVRVIPAYAKINLTLEVLGRRADGYHDLASVMQTIALHDSIALHPAADGSRSLVCDMPELAGDTNLALRAADALAREAGTDATELGVLLELHKAVPIQAGLGGGSSDAACVLVALAALWHLPLSPDRLRTIAAHLGADVPFFLSGGTALARGRGEQIEPLPDIDACWIVLLKPPVAVRTADAFRALTPADFSGGEATIAIVSAVQRTRRVPCEALVNNFEASVYRMYPVVAHAREALTRAGAPVVRLSGSGPTLFAPFESLMSAAQVYARLRAEGHDCWLTHTVSRAEFTRVDALRTST